jgi:hypothetical protein
VKRYTDDFVAAFGLHKDAAKFMKKLKERFTEFGLELAEVKTRKLMFNRYDGFRSETFVFPGYKFRRAVGKVSKLMPVTGFIVILMRSLKPVISLKDT